MRPGQDRSAACSPQVRHRQPSPPLKSPRPLNLAPPFSSGTTHLGPRRRWFVGLRWTAAQHTRAHWRRSVLLSRRPRLSHCRPNPRSAVDPSPIVEELTPAGQPSGAGVGSLSFIHAASPRGGLSTVVRDPLTVGQSTTQLPLHQNSLMAIRAISCFCLPPGTTQRQRNLEVKRFIRATVYSVNIL